MAMLSRTGLWKKIVDKNVVSVSIIPIFNSKRTIYGKAMRTALKEPLRTKPFPYMERNYNIIDNMFDRTLDRLNANAKVIVIDGSIASGKSALAKQIAEEFDMKHYPQANLDMYYVNNYGYDRRSLDHLMPESCKTYDHTNFCKTPVHPSTSSFQILTYTMRYCQYMEALAHIFNTGQGVILERSPFSDYVFVEAMVENNYLSSAARSVYHEIKVNTITDLLRPHLVIYLDTPVDIVKKNIKDRNLPYEQNCKAFTDGYLTSLEKFYKTKYLKEISTHAELLVYDWTQPGETEIILEDIERLDLEKYTYTDLKMQDWCFIDNQEASDYRRLLTNFKNELLANFLVPRFDLPEMVISAEDAIRQDMLLDELLPGHRYAYGYNKMAGDKGLLFKSKAKFRGEDVFN